MKPTFLAPISRPPIDVHPVHDPIAETQQRFRIVGDGPVSQRTIQPHSDGARRAIDQFGTAPVEAAVRGVLRVIEDAAGGADASRGVQLNGVALSDSPQGHGANSYRAQVEDDAVLHASLSQFRGSARQQALHRWAADDVARLTNTEANVGAGWVNLAPRLSDTLRGLAGATPVGVGVPDALESARLIRILRHEAQHVLDGERSALTRNADQSLREALAEANSTTLPDLRRARDAMGLRDHVDDEALLHSTVTFRPYPAGERMLDSLLIAFGMDPAAEPTRALLARPTNEVAKELITRTRAATNASEREAVSFLSEQLEQVLGYEMT